MKGLDTNGSIDVFLRRWPEVSINSFDALGKGNSKWFPIAKGGELRKWFGNHEYIINYENDGIELRKNKANLRNKDMYFQEGEPGLLYQPPVSQ